MHVKECILKKTVLTIFLTFKKQLFCETMSRRENKTYFMLSDFEAILFLLCKQTMCCSQPHILHQVTKWIWKQSTSSSPWVSPVPGSAADVAATFHVFSTPSYRFMTPNAVPQATVFVKADIFLVNLHSILNASQILHYNNKLSLHF